MSTYIRTVLDLDELPAP